MWGISCLCLQCLVPTWRNSSAHCSTLSHYTAAPRLDTKPQWRLFSSRGFCSYKSSSDSCFAHLCLISRPCPFISAAELYAGRLTTTCQPVSRSKPQQQQQQRREALALLQWPFHCRLVTMHFFHAIKQMLYYSSTMLVPSETVYHVKGTPGSGRRALCGAF